MNNPTTRIGTVVDKWLDHLLAQTMERTGTCIRAELEASVGRVVKKELLNSRNLPPDGLGRHVIDLYQDDAHHIRDWLVGAVQRRDGWLLRVNKDGVPLKLAKFGTIQQIVDEADKAIRKLNSGLAAGESFSEVVHSFSNGYKIVSLTTAEDLRSESAMMQHCVGQGAYHVAVESGTTKIFSLRDRHGKAHATVEIDFVDGTVDQVKGKQNRIPKAEYFGMVAEWLNGTDFRFTTSDHPVGYAADRNGKLVRLSDLRAGDEFDGDLEIHLSDADDMPKLPAGLVIGGNLSVRSESADANLTNLSGDVIVGGGLSLSGFRINQDRPFPGDNVCFDRCTIERLPPRIPENSRFSKCNIGGQEWRPVIFGGRVTVFDTEFIKDALRAVTFGSDVIFSQVAVSIPDGMEFGGSVRLVGSNISFEGIARIKGDLTIEAGRLSHAQAVMEIGGNYHAHRTMIQSLPKEMVVGNDLTLSSVGALDDLPSEIRVGRNITIDYCQVKSLNGRSRFYGDLCINRSSVAEISPGATINGSLAVRGGAILCLPEDLTVGQDVTVGPSLIKAVPRSLAVGRNLVIGESEIPTLPVGFKVPGNLDISTSRCFSFPEDVCVGGALIARRADIRGLPASISMNALYAEGAGLNWLPDGFSVEGDLDLRSSAIKELPEGLVVGGYIDLTRTAVVRIPASADISGSLKSDDYIVIERPRPTSAISYGR